MRLRFGSLALVVMLFGCRKPTSDTPDAAPATSAPAPLVTSDDPYAAPPPTPPPMDFPTAAPAETIVETTTIPGSAAPPSPPPDPFLPVIASVQQSGVGCFSGLPPGEYAATVAVVVTAAGTATRIEVTSGPSEPAARKCLEQAAQRAYPSSKEGRKLSIDIRVKG